MKECYVLVEILDDDTMKWTDISFDYSDEIVEWIKSYIEKHSSTRYVAVKVFY
ncbi:MAG: hypothetical protein KDC67_12550 [Ignavibacteriae bacterium]|nr:hypothetical protein [Ignavibacteriota bacterium]